MMCVDWKETHLSVTDAERLVDFPDELLTGTAHQPHQPVMLRDRVGAFRHEAASQHRQHVGRFDRRRPPRRAALPRGSLSPEAPAAALLHAQE